MGKIPLDLTGWKVDLASVSGHKIYGPKGVGALFVRRRPRVRLSPLFSGGGQERGLRSGTLPAPLIVGFGEACRLAAAEMAGEAERIGGLRAALLDRLRRDVPGLRVNGSLQDRIAGNLNLTFPGATAAALMEAGAGAVRFDRIGLLVRRDRAVLRACARWDFPSRRPRGPCVSAIGRFTSPADIDYAAAALSAAHAACAAAIPVR